MHIIFGQFLIELWPLIDIRILFMLNIVDFDQILYMLWYWQDVDFEDWTIFMFIFNRVTALDWCRNFVNAQYLVDQLMDFDKIL